MSNTLKSLLNSLVFVALLSGCLGKLEQSAEETKGYVKKSVDQMADMENIQTKGGAIAIMNDPKFSPDTRYNAFSVLMYDRNVIAEDELNKLIGAQLPLFDRPDAPIIPGFAFPNVTLVHADNEMSLFLTSPHIFVNQEKLNFLVYAALRMPTGLRIPSETDKVRLTFEDWAKRARIASYVVPTILGARAYKDVDENKRPIPEDQRVASTCLWKVASNSKERDLAKKASVVKAVTTMKQVFAVYGDTIPDPNKTRLDFEDAITTKLCLTAEDIR
jgi:hypothetical protein